MLALVMHKYHARNRGIVFFVEHCKGEGHEAKRDLPLTHGALEWCYFTLTLFLEFYCFFVFMHIGFA